MSTIIIGAGVSGLLAAWHLQGRGEEVEVWEAEAQVGGWVQTLPWPTLEGSQGRMEKGPQGLHVAKGSASDKLFKAMDIKLLSPGKGRPWIGRQGKLIPVPDGPIGLVLGRLISGSTRLELIKEPFRPPGEEEPEERLCDFLERRAGVGTVKELLPAIAAGFLGSPPDLLSIDAIPLLKTWEACGSLFQGMRKIPLGERMVPEGGMGTFTKRLAQLVPTPTTRLRAISLQRLPGGQWQVMGDGFKADADNIVLAIPAFEAAKLLAPHSEDAAVLLNAIPYTSMTLWHSRHSLKSHFWQGPGVLIDQMQDRPFLGSQVASWMDRQCATSDLTQLRSCIGDPKLWEDPDPTTQKDGPKDWPWLEERLQYWLPGLPKAVQTLEIKADRAIPRPEIGHRGLIRQLLAALPKGIDWVSNARFGPSIRDVIEGMEQWKKG